MHAKCGAHLNAGQDVYSHTVRLAVSDRWVTATTTWVLSLEVVVKPSYIRSKPIFKGTEHETDDLEGTLHWRCAPVLRQQAGVNIQGAMLGDIQESLRQDVSICRGHADVRLHA